MLTDQLRDLRIEKGLKFILNLKFSQQLLMKKSIINYFRNKVIFYKYQSVSGTLINFYIFQKSKDDSDEEMATTGTKKSGFSALLMDNSEDDLAVDSDEAPVIIKAPEPEKKKDKKKKKNKKKETTPADDDEDDLGNLMFEIK